MDSPIRSLADLPPQQWTPIARWRSLGQSSYWDWLVDDGQDGVDMARAAGTIVTAQRREIGGMVLLAHPVPPHLRQHFRSVMLPFSIS